ncbi:aldehyde dehydrogenase [Candidatus Bathyarchaeota archaeon]|nr:aldehyde dehydrogenase [Candidatus Bathyarchaeota archaeon]
MATTATAAVGASSASKHPVPLIINGRKVYSEDTFDVTSPGSGRVIHQSSNANVTHAQDAIAAGAEAFKSWSQSTPAHRRNIFLKAADVLEDRSAEMKEYMISETGSDDTWADFNLFVAKECLLDCAGRISGIEGRIPSPMDPSMGALIVKEPYGVVLAISPWYVIRTRAPHLRGERVAGCNVSSSLTSYRNAPYILGFRAVIWAIAASNTVVFKGSELSPRALLAVATVLQDAGLPDGVLNYITCDRNNASAVTKTLVESPAIKKINFTGSTAVGRIISELAGANLKPVLLELGGKAPAIVCEDADLEVAAKQCVLGAFMFAGQICMSTERIIVHKSVRSALVEKMTEWAESIFPSLGEAPVLINDQSAVKNRRLVRDALAKGASIACGNVNASESTSSRMRPIVINNVGPGMEVYMEESFGPTVSIVEFETEEEALRIANDTEYGLSAAVFSRDLRKALRMARCIETGAVHINRMTVHDETALPHGGAKSSGFGRFATGMDEWVRTKNITYDI